MLITGGLFLQGLEIVFRVGLAILQMNQAELIQLDMEGMLQVNHQQHFQGRNLHHTLLVCNLPTRPSLWAC